MEITRPRTEVEKDVKSGGFLDLRYWRQNDFRQKMELQIDAKFNEWVYKKRQPYSRTMALNYLEEKVRLVEGKIKQAKDKKETNIKIDINVNWDKFGGFDKFEFINEDDTIETMIISGTRQPTKTGIHREYKCKVTGCQVSMFFNNDEIEKEGLKKDVGSVGKGKQ